jgi:Flp pilus assembly protein TadG
MPSPVASEPSPRPTDRGQAVVELAMCLPLVCLLLLGVVQVAVVVRDQLVVQHAAREAARAAAVSASPAASAALVVGAVARDASIAVAASASRVTATVTRTTHTDVPLIGALIPDVVLTASASMAREPPP